MATVFFSADSLPSGMLTCFCHSKIASLQLRHSVEDKKGSLQRHSVPSNGHERPWILDETEDLGADFHLAYHFSVQCRGGNRKL